MAIVNKYSRVAERLIEKGKRLESGGPIAPPFGTETSSGRQASNPLRRLFREDNLRLKGIRRGGRA